MGEGGGVPFWLKNAFEIPYSNLVHLLLSSVYKLFKALSFLSCKRNPCFWGKTHLFQMWFIFLWHSVYWKIDAEVQNFALNLIYDLDHSK